MVGARHIIQRQFIRGFDVTNDGDENEDTPNLVLMEFMLVTVTSFIPA